VTTLLKMNLFRDIKMVEIKSFCGYIYNIDKVGDISKVIAPPWDVINGEYERSLFQRSPYNAIRLISQNGNPDEVNEIFDKWVPEKILMKSEKEGFYFLKHRFKYQNKELERKGFFALLKLQDFSSGNVIPHEVIFEKHKNNRYSLIDKCRANFSPVFMLYHDEENNIEKILNADSEIITNGELNEEKFIFGIVNEEDKISAIKKFIKSQKLFIADGHHRYQAALSYFKDNPSVENSYILVYLVNMESSELIINPTHRYIPVDIPFEEKMGELKNFFEITKVPDGEKEMFRKMERTEICQHKFGVWDNKNFYVLNLKDKKDPLKYLHSGKSKDWGLLDGVVLHHFILKEIFGMDEKNFIYDFSAEKLIKKCEKSGKGIVFFLNPVTKEQFKNIVGNREIMPPKSTYFYPKVPTGLVIHKFE